MEFKHFPAPYQAVIFRNHGLVPDDTIARVLGTDKQIVQQETNKMGLPSAKEGFPLSRGYVTIIRNNYNLLPDEQICCLLGWTYEYYRRMLYEDDFLFVKLGQKPPCETVRFRLLTEAEERRTAQLKKLVAAALRKIDGGELPYAFSGNYPVYSDSTAKTQGLRIVYSYEATTGDALTDDTLPCYPEKLLESLSSVGINGVWVSEILGRMVPFPFDGRFGEHREKRVKNLNSLIKRAAKYGIKIYLYLNEPRGLTAELAERNPDICGTKENGVYSLCTSTEKVKAYLEEGAFDLANAAPDLGGVITITASENLTNCYSRVYPDGKTSCPRCAKRSKSEVAAEVNALLDHGFKRAGSSLQLIVWNWGWAKVLGWSEAEVFDALSRLPKTAKLMSVSEFELPVNKSGKTDLLYDYSISNVGPSETSRRFWQKAAESGLSPVAKIQLNNSWECAAVPYLPVFPTIIEHIKRLKRSGIDDFMLCWTLGGFPTPAMGLVNLDENKSNAEILDEFLETVYGKKDAPSVTKAVRHFSEGFSYFPFSLAALYFSPVNIGVANLLFDRPSGMKATMVCYPYDDLQAWIVPYTPERFEGLLLKLLRSWKKGLAELERTSSQELPVIATAIYCQYRSTLLQIRYNRLREDTTKKPLLRRILAEEKRLAETMIRLQSKDSRIGFEASNAYFFTQNNLLEKIINCDYLYRHP